MKQIVVVSGKGGTGKTSFTAAFAELAGRSVVLVDADVDAANLALLLDGSDEPPREYQAGRLARIDPVRCTGCGLCVDACRFDALHLAEPHRVVLQDLACEGCGVCAVVCPEDAVSFVPQRAGQWTVRDTAFGPLVHAELVPGAGNSGKLVALLRETSRGLAERLAASWLLIDGPPGIGCPVHAAVTGTDLLVAVTEPTPSALHDLERLLELAARFRLPAAVVLNKADLDPAGTDLVEAAVAARGVELLGRVPFDPEVPRRLAAGTGLLTVPGVRDAVVACWAAVARRAGRANASAAEEGRDAAV
ncbi:MAG: ATP-binding protein [Deltaproteobacteria bacterium]|nr:ATP-binding protein [Deltaproteobacteria bacterium]